MRFRLCWFRYNRIMSLAPALLLSMPQLLDPNFARSVVLLCEHAPEGAFGLIVNRPSEVSAAEAVSLEPPIEHPNDLPLLIGGPVEPQRGWILTTAPPDDVESKGVGAGLHLSASPLLLRRVLTSRPIPRRTHVLAGYAGWGPGQLDAELNDSAWLIMPVELDLIFEIPSAVVWEMAIRRLGADPHLLQMGHGVH
jgi:putative transcriptional regulator